MSHMGQERLSEWPPLATPGPRFALRAGRRPWHGACKSRGMENRPRISVIVPNYNGAATLALCLESIFASDHGSFEVIVVDDASTDTSREIAQPFPCRLVELSLRSGTGRARTTGALHSTGEILFFTDADCLLQKDTLRRVETAVNRLGETVIVGGTYTPVPHDRDFFSLFQSVFIHHSELRNVDSPDYVAGHAMAIAATTFWKTGGFPENRLPILEDVEYSHGLRRTGYRLLIRPDILVQHVFNFNLYRSFRNGWRKSFYWTRYSLANRDLCADSGTASRSLKVTVGMHSIFLLLVVLQASVPPVWMACLGGALAACVFWTNRNLLRAFRRVAGPVRAGLLFLYYAALYPFCIETGSALGYMAHLREVLFSAKPETTALVPLPASAETGPAGSGRRFVAG